MKNYVIIGNGVAAAGCIEGIRSVDKASGITVVSAENHPVYCRPLISYYLEGKTTLQKMNYRADDFYSANGCDCLYGKQAVKIDKDNKRVILDDNSEIPYDSLCIATGSSPFVPPFAGLDTVTDKFSFMTIDDTLALEGAINKDSRVLIVGAGLIGLKCAEGIAEKVSQITVCDLADRILSSILDNECAAIMQKHLENHGIRFMLGDTVDKFDGNTAVMKKGGVVDFDVVVLAVGVRANTAVVKDIGGRVNRGIIVDDKMRTSVDDIYAAGDCTEGNDISLGQKRVLAILPNAYMQGSCAGVNMAGGDAVFDNAIPMNSIGFFGLHAMTAGSYFAEGDGGELYEEKTDAGIKRLYMKDGLLTGYIIIGDVNRAGIYTSLVREKTPLSEVNVELLKKNPTLAIFSSEICRKKLGGVI
ncbi:MAG: NAD(P)/FAD-dependent oxidoreductase [Clostridia bacterium]|nr:NAD(P)/FAD-dependent oxidoreductase [Clostridia bacterium]